MNWGVKTLFVSNASGGLSPEMRIGDMMFITDHINFFPEHPLRGKNFPTGPRFPDMSEAYDHQLLNLRPRNSQGETIAPRRGGVCRHFRSHFRDAGRI